MTAEWIAETWRRPCDAKKGGAGHSPRPAGSCEAQTRQTCGCWLRRLGGAAGAELQVVELHKQQLDHHHSDHMKHSRAVIDAAAAVQQPSVQWGIPYFTGRIQEAGCSVGDRQQAASLCMRTCPRSSLGEKTTGGGRGKVCAPGRHASWGSVELNMSFMALYASWVLMVTVGSSTDSGASGSAPEKAPPNRSKDVVSSPARPAPAWRLWAEKFYEGKGLIIFARLQVDNPIVYTLQTWSY